MVWCLQLDTQITPYYVHYRALLHYHLPDLPFGNELLIEPPDTDINDLTVITGEFANIVFQPQLQSTPLKLTTAVQPLEKDLVLPYPGCTSQKAKTVCSWLTDS